MATTRSANIWISKVHKHLLVILLVIVSYVPIALIPYFNPPPDIFTGRYLTVIRSAELNGHFTWNFGSNTHPAMETTVYVLHEVTGISLTRFPALPFAGFLFILSVFILTWSLFRSLAVASLFSVIYGFQYSSGVPFFTLIPHGWGTALYLFSIMILLKIEKNTRPYIIFTFLIMLIGVNFYSYSRMFLILIALGLSIIMVSSKKNTKKQSSLLWTSLILGIILFSTNDIIYRAYLPLVLEEIYLSNAIDRILVKIPLLSHLLYNSHQIILFKYQFIERTPTPLYELNLIYTFLLLLSPVLLMLYIYMKRINLSQYTMFIYISIGSIIIFMFFYYLRGHANYAPLIYLSPLISFAILKEVSEHRPDLKKIAAIFLITLAFINIFRTYYAIDYDIFLPQSTPGYAGSSSWILYHIRTSSAILSDFDGFGKLYVATLTINKTFREIHYNPKYYGCVIGREECSFGCGNTLYVYADMKTRKGVETDLWIRFKPLMEYRESIITNPSLNLIYEDENSWILMFSSSTC